MNNPPDFICQFRRIVWRRDYPFQIACLQPPHPLRKNRRRGVCGEGATVHRLVSDGESISSSSVNTVNDKIPLSTVFNDSEGLYGTNVCRCLVRRPHSISRGKCVSGHVVRASSPLKCLDRDCVGRRPTGTRRGNAYRGVREKLGNVVYRQRVLQTVTSLSVAVSLLFGGHNLLKIAWQRLPWRQRKTGKCCLSATCFTNSDISECCFTTVWRAQPPENRKY